MNSEKMTASLSIDAKYVERTVTEHSHTSTTLRFRR